MPVFARITFPHRLAVRQALPIFAGLLCLLCAALLLGYRQARNTVLDAAGTRARQLSEAGSLTAAVFLQRSEKRMAGIARCLEQAGPHGAAAMLRPASSLARLIKAGFAGEQGWKQVTVRVTDGNGTLHSAAWRRAAEGGAPEVGFIVPGNDAGNPLFSDDDTEKDPPDGVGHWRRAASPENSRDVPLRYAIPLALTGADHSPAFGEVSLVVDTAWLIAFVERAASFEGIRTTILPSPAMPPGAIPGDSAGTRARQTAAFAPLAPEDSYLGVLVPEETLFAQVDALARTFFLLALAAVLPAVWSLHATTRGMLRPLEYLTDMAARLSRGDLGTPGGRAGGPSLPPRPRRGRNANADEPARLVRAADALRLALRQRAEDLTLVATARERLLGELALARAIQEGIRPRELPRAANVDTAAHLHVTRAVCGDMYDAFFRSPHALCCVLGDVASRGVPASLLMGRVMPLLRELLLSGMRPSAALETVNRTLCVGGGNSMAKDFIGAVAGVLDIRNGLFTWAGAGKPPPLRFNAASVLELPWSENIPLGIRRGARYHDLETQLQTGDGLFFASDGLHSAQSGDGSLYGEKRLAETLRQLVSERAIPDCQSLLRAMHEDMLAHAAPTGPQDDIAMLAARWKGP